MALPPTFLDCVTQAYRMAGVLLGPGRGISPEEMEEGRHIANAMLDGLKIQRCFFYQVIRTLFDTVADQQDYLVGDANDGAEWLIERPEKILGAGIILSTDAPDPAELPMKVLQDFVQWQAVAFKEMTSTTSWVLYYRATLPVGTASVWPIPRVDGQVALYTPGTIDEIDDLMAPARFPKGYREFFEYQLAENVHDRYPNAPMSPTIPVKARDYKARVMAAQYTPLYTTCDAASLARTDNRWGRWGRGGAIDVGEWLP
jgi:hypothetical protein